MGGFGGFSFPSHSLSHFFSSGTLVFCKCLSCDVQWHQRDNMWIIQKIREYNECVVNMPNSLDHTMQCLIWVCPFFLGSSTLFYCIRYI